MKTNISDKENLSEIMLREIQTRIVMGEYPPGQILSEKELCEEFRVSRMPFREAILKLKALKLVKVVPRFGSYVADIDILEVRNAFEVRCPLEVEAARLAARRRTDEHLERMGVLLADVESCQGSEDRLVTSKFDKRFHRLVYEASGNPILVETLNNINLICYRIWNSFQSDTFNMNEVIEDTRSVYKALKEKNEKALAGLMELHMQRTLDSLRDQFF